MALSPDVVNETLVSRAGPYTSRTQLIDESDSLRY